MNIEELSFEKLPFSDLFRTYISNLSSLKSFFEYDYQNPDDIKRKTDELRFSGDRQKLVSALKYFNAPFELHQNAQANLEALAQSDTLTVTTGQQMVISGGPLFTIFKTITAIHYAHKVEEVTGRKTVPVFWLADEDHDFEEVAGITIPSGDEIHTVSVKEKVNPEGHAVSRISLKGCQGSFFADLKEHLYETDFTAEVFGLIKEAYGENCSFKIGFGRLLSTLFSEYGLILAGSDDKAIKELTADVFVQSVEKNQQVIAALNDKSEEIANVHHAQAQVQDTLIFYHDEQNGRQRIKLSEDDGNWLIDSGKSWNTAQLLEEVRKHPEHFSPNVFLRPVLQDVLLPNVAYVAGPGEIAYYAQMKSMYEVFGLRMPLIVPRLSATLVEASVRRISKDLHFEFSDFQKRIEDLEKEFLAQSSEDDLEKLFENWKSEIDELTEKHSEIISKYDPSLKKSAESMTIGYHKSLDKLSQKLRKSLKQRKEIQIQRIRKIKNNIFPGDNLQEREIAAIYFMNKYGMDVWSDLLEATKESNLSSHKIVFL